MWFDSAREQAPKVLDKITERFARLESWLKERISLSNFQHVASDTLAWRRDHPGFVYKVPYISEEVEDELYGVCRASKLPEKSLRVFFERVLYLGFGRCSDTTHNNAFENCLEFESPRLFIRKVDREILEEENLDENWDRLEHEWNCYDVRKTSYFSGDRLNKFVFQDAPIADWAIYAANSSSFLHNAGFELSELPEPIVSCGDDWEDWSKVEGFWAHFKNQVGARSYVVPVLEAPVEAKIAAYSLTKSLTMAASGLIASPGLCEAIVRENETKI